LSASDLEGHMFLNLVILDGRSITFIPAQLKKVDGNSFTMSLPEKGYCLGKRRSMRYRCQEITAEISQAGFIARGELMDFSPNCFRIKVSVKSNSSFHWLNSDNPISIKLTQHGETLFSGVCQFIRQTGGHSDREFVLAPISNRINRFKRKKTHTPRFRVIPIATVSFEHPLFKKTVQRDIYDMSISGFSVYEDYDEGVLIPGLIIPKLYINCTGATKMRCSAQVTARYADRPGKVRYGMAILDMDFSTYSRLSHIITNVMDPHIRIDDDIDMDSLWEFLFDTGFIYASKYNIIYPHRDDFKETYKKLYQNNPQIAVHVTYHHHGKMYGHVSMLKAYERTWMVHHLAARPIGKRHTGLSVLKQILNYYEGLYRLPSIQMDYMMFYFRPENHFPNLFFGGFARDLNNPRACSMDLFSFQNYSVPEPRMPLPEGWKIEKCSPQHESELERFYRNHSGGLLLNILQLGEGDNHAYFKSLEETYESYGLIRKWNIYSLTCMNQLKAIFLVDQANLGINLSELLNSIKVIVTDAPELPWSILSCAINQLARIYHVNQLPVLIYPHTYLEEKSIPYDKKYFLWILDAQYGKEYLEYMQDKVKIKLGVVIKHLFNKMLKK
ncbi:MAG: hypothetical protein ABSB79_08850, partial [Syntrophales bacterium]